MNKLIELVGPPGVGKSTVYHSLCKTWNNNAKWVYEDMLLAPKKPGFFKTLKWLEYNYRLLFGKQLSKSIPVEYGLRFINKNEHLAAFIWNHLSDDKYPVNNKIDQRFRATYFLYDTFCRYQALKEKRGNKPCFIEEGFFQKSFLVHNNGEKNVPDHIDFLEKYLSLVPLPYALIHIDIQDTSLIVKRLRLRKKVIASHIGMDDDEMIRETEKWQQLLSLMLAKLKDKGVLVFDINGEKPVAQNVVIIKSLLQDLANSHQ